MIKIFIFAFNRPDLLPIQLDTINKYLIGDYSIQVVYDYREDLYGQQFEKVCIEKEVSLLRHNSFPNKSPSQYHADSLNWIYSNKVTDNDLVIFIDHDMFLVDYFNPYEYLLEYDVSACLHSRGHVEYTWPGLFLFKFDSIKDIKFDFNPKMVDGHSLDSGGGTYSILRNSNIKFLPIKIEYPDSYDNIDLLDPKNNDGFCFELFMGGKFLHSRNACSWHKNMQVENTKKTEILNFILKDFL